MKEYLKLTNDIVFQRVFGKIGNEHITKAFLEKVLGIKIDNLTLDTNKRLIGERVDEKIGRVDVKAVLSNGTKVIIEMQVLRYKHMAKRMLYYWAQTYVGDLKRGEEYKKLEKTIAILISEEELEETNGIKRYHSKWEIRETESREKKLTEDLEIHIIELSKFKEGKKKRPEDNWIKAIKAKEVGDMEKVSKIDEEIEKVREELIKITADANLRDVYYQREKDLRDKLSLMVDWKEEGYEKGMEKGIKEGRKKGIKEGIKEGRKEGIKEGRKEGREEGREEGIKENRREIIINMYKMKMDIKTICQITKVTKEEVEKIVKEESKISVNK